MGCVFVAVLPNMFLKYESAGRGLGYWKGNNQYIFHVDGNKHVVGNVDEFEDHICTHILRMIGTPSLRTKTVLVSLCHCGV